MPAHSYFKGNEKADMLAKRGSTLEEVNLTLAVVESVIKTKLVRWISQEHCN